MSEICKLKRQRGFIRGQLTRLKNYLRSVDSENLTDLVLSQLQSRFDKAEPLLCQFDEYQREIEALLYQDESTSDQESIKNILDIENKEYVEFENEYFQIISQLKLLLSRNVNSKGNSNDSNSERFSPPAFVQSPRQSRLKLPEIKISSFNGSFEKWLGRDAFQAIVHDNSQLSNVEKFYYLKSFLQDEPLQVIANLPVTNDNYLIAWNLLIERFENKRLIIYNYIKALFDCPNLIKESHANLRNLYDLFNKNLRSLKSLGQATENWDTLFICLLINLMGLLEENGSHIL